jgi:hypothetical protein
MIFTIHDHDQHNTQVLRIRGPELLAFDVKEAPSKIFKRDRDWRQNLKLEIAHSEEFSFMVTSLRREVLTTHC